MPRLSSIGRRRTQSTFIDAPEEFRERAGREQCLLVQPRCDCMDVPRLAHHVGDPPGFKHSVAGRLPLREAVRTRTATSGSPGQSDAIRQLAAGVTLSVTHPLTGSDI